MGATALPIANWHPVRSTRPATAAITLFVWLLPFHSLVVALLVGSRSLPFDTIRLIAAWKELAVVLIVAWIAARAMLGANGGTTVSPVDLVVGGLIGLAGIFLTVENPIFRAGIPAGAELYGFRDTVFFMLLYFAGRGMPELASGGRVLRHLFLMAVVISLIGIVERIFVTPELLVLLGVASYVNDFLGMSAFTEGTVWGLPQNYWTIMGGVAIQRAGSVFLHSQGFALPFLLLMPAATAWALTRRQRFQHLVWMGYAAVWAGLLLTITRMTIVVCAIQVVLYFAITRKSEWSMGTVIAGLAGLAVAIAMMPGLRIFVWETLTWQTGSSESHVKDWGRGLVAFLEQPWGHGLGTAEQVAIRFNIVPVSADNIFLAYATQLGLPGLVGLVAALFAILATSWRLFRTANDQPERQLGVAMTLATLGIMLNGATSSIFSSNLLAYVFFLLAGVVVTLRQRLVTETRR